MDSAGRKGKREETMLDKELEYTLNIAFKEAREKRHEYFTVEHLVNGLLENSAVVKILKSCNADIPSLKKKLGAFISKSTPKIPPSVNDRDTQPTLGLQRVLQRAVFRAQSSGLLEATGAHVLEAIFDETASRSVYFWNKKALHDKRLKMKFIKDLRSRIELINQII